MAALGAGVIKAQLYWNEVSPRVRRKPAGFDSADPASYDWSAYDGLVQAIVARGMRPYLTIGNRAPDWAVRRRTPSPRDGIYKPSSKEFRLFAQAAGRHFDGTVDGVPRVSLWAIWNEPNLKSWLSPQRSSKGVPLAPSIYRNLYIAGHRGLAETGHGSDTILLGELMPLGAGSPRSSRRSTSCARWSALTAATASTAAPPRRLATAEKVGRIATSGIALHPYTSRAGLRSRPKPGETPINALSRLTHQLDLLARRGKLPRRLPVWLTEYGFQTNPPDPYQLSIKKAPGQMDQSEWIAFRNRRVRSYSQYTLVDEGLNAGGGFQRYARFQMGLRFSDGRRQRACTTRSACRRSSGCSAPGAWRFSAGCAPSRCGCPDRVSPPDWQLPSAGTGATQLRRVLPRVLSASGAPHAPTGSRSMAARGSRSPSGPDSSEQAARRDATA